MVVSEEYAEKLININLGKSIVNGFANTPTVRLHLAWELFSAGPMELFRVYSTWLNLVWVFIRKYWKIAVLDSNI